MAEPKPPRALEDMDSPGDARLQSPSASRNKAPLLAALRPALQTVEQVLEIASGTGEHAIHFCTALPHLQWQPSEVADEALASIDAWRAATGLANLAAPLRLDMTAADWWAEVTPAPEFILCCNMIHISPWVTTEGLFAGAGQLLPAGGMVALYGPFAKDGVHTSPSNEAFDQSLRARDPSWGVRDIADVARVAKGADLSLDQDISMPANNRVLMFRKGDA